MIFWGRYAMHLVTHFHFCPCPLVTTVLGLPIMAAALAVYKKPAMLIGIGSVAAVFHWIAVPLNHVQLFSSPFITYSYVNPTIFILLSSLTFSLIASLVKRRLTFTTRTLIGMGALAGILSTVAWIHIVDLLGAPILTSTGLHTSLAYLATNGVIWVAISTATLPLGYVVGLRLPMKTSRLFRVRPWLYRLGPFAVILLCWVGSILTFTTAL
jgi:uncharacterized protein YhhL (DUF1145 family)